MTEPTYKLPAEWEAHAACWLAWPSDPALWLDDLAPAREAVAAMCRAVARTGERVELLAPAGEEPDVDARFHDVPFGDVWLRDTGPIFVRDGDGALAAMRFEWNGWGGKYHFAADDGVGDAIAAIAGAPVQRHAWILEGGAIEVDGAGALLTTRQCLLNPNRNPGMLECEVDAALRDAFGAERVYWLDQGLRNDHTDGHVDNIARFVASGVAMCMEPTGADDPNRDVLDAVARDLAGFGFDVVRIPSPGRVLDAAGAVMPASYVNFYIGNGAVIVPIYGQPSDDDALARIQSAFPSREVVGIDARGLLTGGGAFHCISREQPA